MKTLKFMGYSDDTFGEYGTTNQDVDNCASGKPIQCMIEADGIEIYVTGQYNRIGTGTWDIGVSLLNDENTLPDWKMRMSFEGYTTVLEIDVPDNFKLTWYDDGEVVKAD